MMYLGILFPISETEHESFCGKSSQSNCFSGEFQDGKIRMKETSGGSLHDVPKDRQFYLYLYIAGILATNILLLLNRQQ